MQKGAGVTIISIWFSLTAVLFAFQNCAQQKLEEVVVDSYSAPSTKFSSQVCNDPRQVDASGTKYIFIVDMSASNMAAFKANPVGSNFVYYDASQATDLEKARLTAINNFLAPMGDDQGDKFAVIGFSKTAGTVKTIAGRKVLDCSSPVFVKSSVAQAHVEDLKVVQDQDIVWYQKWKLEEGKYLSEYPPDSHVMGPTSYNSALDCASELVLQDLIKNTDNQIDSYKIFFMSDGKPEDPKGEGCNAPGVTDKDACYINKASDATALMRTAAYAKGKSLVINGIFYGGISPTHVVLDEVVNMGGGSGVVELASFAEDTDALLDLATTWSALDYRPDVANAIVLTAIRHNGSLKADSDMDGITDDLDPSPNNPRSMVQGVLDGVCMRLGGQSECQSKKALVVCDESIHIGIGLTECDYKILGLHLLPGQNTLASSIGGPIEQRIGIDSDQDSMLDFVEIIKGTNPAEKDMNDDPDADGVVNLNEIINGTDPFVPDTDILVRKLNDIKLEYTEKADPRNECFSGTKILVNRLQLVRNEEVPVQTGREDLISTLTHSYNEHMVLFFYRLTPQNSVAPVSEVYYNIVPFSYSMDSTGVETIAPLLSSEAGVRTYLLQSEYTFLGKVRL